VFEDPASGTAMDYFKNISVKYPVTVKFRGGAGIGFIIDKGNIQLSFNEVWNGLTMHIDAITTSPPEASNKVVSVSPTASVGLIVVGVFVFTFSSSYLRFLYIF